MKINTTVPRRHQPVLDYMRTIEPVSKTLDDLIAALIALSKGSDEEDLPESVQGNKGFDGHSESRMVADCIKGKRSLLLRVQRGYIDQRQGDPKAVLAQHLAMSDRFHIAFVTQIKGAKAEEGRFRGVEFTIYRDGKLGTSVNSASSLVSDW